MEIAGPIRWQTLHTRKWSDPVADLEWLRGEFALSLPCGSCRSDFMAYLRDHPPRLDSPEAAFAWTVELHNSLNAKLGKAAMTIEEARRLWLDDDAHVIIAGSAREGGHPVPSSNHQPATSD
jgi:hypothetical protein